MLKYLACDADMSSIFTSTESTGRPPTLDLVPSMPPSPYQEFPSSTAGYQTPPDITPPPGKVRVVEPENTVEKEIGECRFEENSSYECGFVTDVCLWKMRNQF